MEFIISGSASDRPTSDFTTCLMKAKLEKQLVALPTDKEKFVNTLEAGVGGKYG
jgi:hypothetical protein